MNEKHAVRRRRAPRIVIRVSMRQAVGDRENQEDAMAVSPPEAAAQKGILAVLADGMGGMNSGEKFSAIATQEMQNCFAAMPPGNDLCAMLETCYQAAQEKAVAEQKADEAGGSTVAAVLIRHGKCAFLSAGDSRICLLRGGGLIQLNREHVFGHMLDERAALGYITREEAELNLERSALTCHLGRKNRIEPDICTKPIALIPNDKILLMSDGVFGTLNDEQLVQLASLPHPRGAAAMIEAVLAKKKPRQDNCSILLISIDKAANYEGRKLHEPGNG